ncbi:MAG TPA: histidine kinase, partial [Burkholderiaceae bacterium]
MSNPSPLLHAPRAEPRSESDRRLWQGYAATCLLAWLLFVLAGTELQRGLWAFWEAAYQATQTLWAPMLLGALVLPWVRVLNRSELSAWGLLSAHLLAAGLFAAVWLALDFGLAWALFGPEHAMATLAQSILWRTIWGLLVYAALVSGFTAALNARRARVLAVAAAQAESALARAELAAISGKLNPHFLFNTLNSLIALTRKDARA